MNGYDIFRAHPENLTILSHAGDIKVSTPRSIMHPTAPVRQFNPSEMLKKIAKRNALIFSNFKDGKFWDN